MFRLRSVDVLSVARVMAFIYGLLGLVGAVFLILFGGMFAAFSRQAGGPALFSGGMSIVMGIMAPFIYAAIGFVGGAIMALVYNFVAARFGGVRIELEQVPPLS